MLEVEGLFTMFISSFLLLQVEAMLRDISYQLQDPVGQLVAPKPASKPDVHRKCSLELLKTEEKDGDEDNHDYGKDGVLEEHSGDSSSDEGENDQNNSNYSEKGHGGAEEEDFVEQNSDEYNDDDKNNGENHNDEDERESLETEEDEQDEDEDEDDEDEELQPPRKKKK